MGEEAVDNLRYRNGDKDMKRTNYYRGSNRGEDEGSKHKDVGFNGSIKASFMAEGEEGEIPSGQTGGTSVACLPSAEFQKELLNTQASPKGVPVTESGGHVLGQPAVEINQKNSAMEFDEQFKDMAMNGSGFVEEDGSQEGFQVGTDEENDELSGQGLVTEDKDGEGGKKQGSRRRAFKPLAVTAGSSKMRMVQALASPRKRAEAKVEGRKGDGVKQEGKGPSIPKPGLPLP